MKLVKNHVMQTNMQLVKCVRKRPCLYDHTRSDYGSKQHADPAWEAVAREMNLTVEVTRARWRNLRISYLRYLRLQKKGDKDIKPYYMCEVMSFMEPYVRTLDASPIIKAETSKTSLTDDEEEPKMICTISQAYSPRESTEDEDNNLVFTITDENDLKKEDDIHFKDITEKLKESNFMEVIERDDPLDDDLESQEHAAEDPSKQLESFNTQTEHLLMELCNPDLSFFRSLLPDVERMKPDQKNKFKLVILNAVNSILYENE